MRKIFAALLLLSLLPLAACGGGELVADDTFEYFNTRLRWVHEPHEAKQGEICSSLFALAGQVEGSLSSEGEGAIARFNAAAAGEKVEIDEFSYRTLTLAKRLYEETEGAFNPALGLYTDLWGFSPRFEEGEGAAMPYDRTDPSQELPDAKYIGGFLPLTDFSAVVLSAEEQRYFARKPDVTAEIDGVVYTMQLDLGGIGKGMCIDILADHLAGRYEAEGFGELEGYLALAESSMALFADPRREGFEVGLTHPRSDRFTQFLKLKAQNVTVSTSGDSVRSYTIGGRRYSHIIDGATGCPTQSTVASATVFCASAAEGDALSTALVVMGRERACKYISEHGITAVLFDAEENAVYTNLTDAELLDETLREVRI